MKKGFKQWKNYFLETVLLCIILSRVNSEKYLYLYFLHCTKLSILMGLLATLSREGKNGPLYLFCYHNLGSFCICICICICLYFIQSYNIRSWREVFLFVFVFVFVFVLIFVFHSKLQHQVVKGNPPLSLLWSQSRK